MSTNPYSETWDYTLGQVPAGYNQDYGTGGVTVQPAPAYFPAGTKALRITGSGYRRIFGSLPPGFTNDDTFGFLFAAEAPAGAAAGAAPVGSGVIFFDYNGSDGYFLGIDFSGGTAKLARATVSTPLDQATIPAGVLTASSAVTIAVGRGPAAGALRMYVRRVADGQFLTRTGWQAAAAPLLSGTDPSPLTGAGVYGFSADTAGTFWVGQLDACPAGSPTLAPSPSSVMDGGSSTIGIAGFTGGAAALTVTGGGSLAGRAYTAPSSGSGTATFAATGKLLASETASAQVGYAPAAGGAIYIVGGSFGGFFVGTPATFYVFLGNAPVLSTDLVIALNGTNLTVPASVTLPAGAAFTFFQATPTGGAFTVGGSAAGFQVAGDGAAPARGALAVLIPPAVIGQPTQGFVELAGVPPLGGDRVLALAATGATVPATVTLPAGAYSVPFALTPTAASFTIGATAAGLSSYPAASGTATQAPAVTPTPTPTQTSASALGLSVPLGTIGRADRGSVALLGGAALTAATTVSLSATGATVPSSVIIPAGALLAPFAITPTSTSYTVSAAAPGLTAAPGVAGSAVAAGLSEADGDLVAGRLLGLVGALEAGRTLKQSLRKILASAAGPVDETSAPGEVVFRLSDGTDAFRVPSTGRTSVTEGADL